MRKLGFFLIATVGLFFGLLASTGSVSAAAPSGHITGGGTGTFDGATTGSHFGLGVVVYADGTAQGHFTCVMAGNAAFELPDGSFLHLMSVEGQVDHASVSSSGTGLFSGAGTLHVNGLKDDVTFMVHVMEGGPGVGKLQLTVNGINVSGFPSSVTFPVETVLTGQIDVH